MQIGSGRQTGRAGKERRELRVKTQIGRKQGVEIDRPQTARPFAPGGFAGWLLARLRRTPRPRAHLTLVERVALAPRQSLALIEADGRRLLVATSADSTPVFYPLDNHVVDNHAVENHEVDDHEVDDPRRGSSSAQAISSAQAPAHSLSSSRRGSRGRASAAKSAPRVSW
jgi:flagellar biogenesis protein FliO